MASELVSLSLRGFKTIRQLDDFRPGRLNVLIGANGAGKSNLISFFRMLSWMAAGDFATYVGVQGGASALLHAGPGRTREIEARLTLRTESGDNDYHFRLFHAAGDTLIFADERCQYRPAGVMGERWFEFGAGHREARLREQDHATPRTIAALLRKLIVHQFHDTSASARARNKWRADDGRWLKEDAGNLAAFLLRLREQEPACYGRIVETLRLMLPFFVDFALEPEHGSVLLQWREKGHDALLSASQAADGMLRTMALVALLQQPARDLPAVLVLDEPELGLHPYAIQVVAGLLQAASLHAQVFIATQSVALLDQFQPQDVVVVERDRVESCYARLDADRLREWLDDYSLSELWTKNVLGGRP
jgi:predicted ATPase